MTASSADWAATRRTLIGAVHHMCIDALTWARDGAGRSTRAAEQATKWAEALDAELGHACEKEGKGRGAGVGRQLSKAEFQAREKKNRPRLVLVLG